jgi:hypothetical protein
MQPKSSSRPGGPSAKREPSPGGLGINADQDPRAPEARHCFAPAIYPLNALPFSSTEFFRSLFSRAVSWEKMMGFKPLRYSLNANNYGATITPQAILPPALPVGSVIMSSAFS